jgi:hypothetical protein
MKLEISFELSRDFSVTGRMEYSNLKNNGRILMLLIVDKAIIVIVINK